MRKRILSYLLCGVLLVTGLCGCGAAQQTGDASDDEQQTVVEEQICVAEDIKEVENITEETVATTAGVQESELTIADISSMELVADMKIGWSLGNTLDATGGMGISSEWSWGNPKTSQEMIDAILAQGFNVIRIPVTWEGHFGAAPEYKIHDAWMERVQEVVDYAYNRGAYVILNIHHEEWHFPSEENKAAASAQLTALWTQIANHFKDYDEHLIFEGLNEPRKKGTAVEWTGGDKEGREVVNHFAQVFVNTVRATGGNNTLRHLMITGYAASSERKALEAIVLPNDDKLIISVHAYTPYNFALNTGGTSTWDIERDTRDIDSVMNTIQDLFLSKGIPVIIGEFGAMNKDNEAERVEWVTYYLTKAKEIGVPCVWWDNNAFTGNGEKFGLLDRRNLVFPYPNLVNAMMSVVGQTPITQELTEGINQEAAPDAVSGEGKRLFSGSNSASGDWNNWQTVVELSIDDIMSLTEGQALKVEYQSTIGPCLILQSWTGGPNWIQMTPSSDDGKTAVFTYEDIAMAYGGPLTNLNATMIRPYGADITVTSVDIMTIQ